MDLKTVIQNDEFEYIDWEEIDSDLPESIPQRLIDWEDYIKKIDDNPNEGDVELSLNEIQKTVYYYQRFRKFDPSERGTKTPEEFEKFLEDAINNPKYFDTANKEDVEDFFKNLQSKINDFRDKFNKNPWKMYLPENKIPKKYEKWQKFLDDMNKKLDELPTETQGGNDPTGSGIVPLQTENEFPMAKEFHKFMVRIHNHRLNGSNEKIKSEITDFKEIFEEHYYHDFFKDYYAEILKDNIRRSISDLFKLLTEAEDEEVVSDEDNEIVEDEVDEDDDSINKNIEEIKETIWEDISSLIIHNLKGNILWYELGSLTPKRLVYWFDYIKEDDDTPEDDGGDKPEDGEGGDKPEDGDKPKDDVIKEFRKNILYFRVDENNLSDAIKFYVEKLRKFPIEKYVLPHFSKPVTMKKIAKKYNQVERYLAWVLFI